MEPKSIQWVKVNTKQKDTDGLIDEDRLDRNHISVYPSLVSLLENKFTVMKKNELNESKAVPDNRNMRLVYFKEPMPNTSMSMNNFVNIMYGEQIGDEDGIRCTLYILLGHLMIKYKALETITCPMKVTPNANGLDYDILVTICLCMRYQFSEILGKPFFVVTFFSSTFSCLGN